MPVSPSTGYVVLLHGSPAPSDKRSPRGLIFPGLSRKVPSDLALVDQLVERTGSVAPSVHTAAPFLCVLLVQRVLAGWGYVWGYGSARL